jgi:hypothetical protein
MIPVRLLLGEDEISGNPGDQSARDRAERKVEGIEETREEYPEAKQNNESCKKGH